MTRSRTAGLLVAAVMAASLLGAAGPAAATSVPPADAPAPAAAAPPRGVEIGTIRLAAPGSGGLHPRVALLVPVTYPLHMKGRQAGLFVSLYARRHEVRGSAREVSATLSAGLPRDSADPRRSFTFVHRVALPATTAQRLLRRDGRLDVRVLASAVLDVNRDENPEARSTAIRNQLVRPVRAGGRVVCSSSPLRFAKRGRPALLAVPQCTIPMRWSVARAPRHGRIQRSGDPAAFRYRPAAAHRGWDALVLSGRPADSASTSAAAGAVSAPVALHVGSGLAPTTSVRAIGDSVTAGFGYYDDGTPMTIEDLLDCRPSSNLYDACSSNALTTSNSGPLRYAPDYGLSNLVAWPARWAGWNAITNFANYAVTGSTPADWAPGGQFYAQTRAAESAAPDYLVFTAGANPLLSDTLFGLDPMKCALWSDLLGGYTQCVLSAFRAAGLQQNLARLYADLLARTPSSTQILAMQYHLAIPSSALAYTSQQLERMGDLLNATIAEVVAAQGSSRLRVISPPRFDVGIDMSPLAPASFDCGDGGLVDGPSVQSSATQYELDYDPLGGPFCAGPALGGPWIISADTGIHPSVAGHAMMAEALPTP